MSRNVDPSEDTGANVDPSEDTGLERNVDPSEGDVDPSEGIDIWSENQLEGDEDKRKRPNRSNPLRA